MKDTLTRRQLNRATLARQLLLERHPISAVEAVERLCGLQAQEAKPPYVGLWTRVEAFGREELSEALRAREVVRATLMRATLHLMSARDYVALRASLAPALTQAMGVLGARADGLEVEKVLPVARGLLEEQPRAFNELRALLAEAFPRVNDRALGYSVRLQLPLVMIPTETPWTFPPVADFTLADAWLGESLATDGSPEPLVLRYLAAFSPATAAGRADLVRPQRDQARARPAAAAAVRLPGRARARAIRSARCAASRRRRVRPASLPPRVRQPRPVARRPDARPRGRAPGSVVTKNLRVRATFLWDGFVRGTWAVERKKAVATMLLAPFGALPKTAVKALAEEGEALLRFLEEDAATFDVKLAT